MTISTSNSDTEGPIPQEDFLAGLVQISMFLDISALVRQLKFRQRGKAVVEEDSESIVQEVMKEQALFLVEAEPEVHVVAVDVPERAGAKQLLSKVNQERERFPRLTGIWVDRGFSGEDFMRWVIDTFRWILDNVLRPQGTEGFVLLPQRWVLERTYGWLH